MIVATENIVEIAVVQATKSATKPGTIKVAKKAVKVAVKKSIKGTVIIQVGFRRHNLYYEHEQSFV